MCSVEQVSDEQQHGGANWARGGVNGPHQPQQFRADAPAQGKFRAIREQQPTFLRQRFGVVHRSDAATVRAYNKQFTDALAAGQSALEVGQRMEDDDGRTIRAGEPGILILGLDVQDVHGRNEDPAGTGIQ